MILVNKKNLLGNGGSFCDSYRLMHPVADVRPDVLALALTKHFVASLIIRQHGQFDVGGLMFADDSGESFSVMYDGVIGTYDEQNW